MFYKISAKIATWLATPWAILGVPILSAVWLVFWSDDALTLVLSVLAFTSFQLLLLVGQEREKVAAARDKALHDKINSLVVAVPGADNDLAGCEPNHPDSTKP